MQKMLVGIRSGLINYLTHFQQYLPYHSKFEVEQERYEVGSEPSIVQLSIFMLHEVFTTSREYMKGWY